MRRVLLALAPAALLALAGCGSSTIESQFVPSRIVVFGDALSDMGNTPNGNRYTVNDASATWPQIVALDYGYTLAKSTAGGTDYAYGNARVVQEPDAAGGTATLTIKEQIDAFLAAQSTFNAGDLVLLEGGASDIIVQMQAFRSGAITSDQMIANVTQAGHDLAAQARRITAAGATHVLIVSLYDLKVTPWAAAIGQQDLLSQATTAFNNAVLVDLVNEGDKMLFVDIALLLNLMSGTPSAYGLVNSTDPICTSVDPGPGIGIGANQVNSALCTPTTIVTGATVSQYLWADAVYPAPTGHARIGDYVFQRVQNRW
jgi:phospholipase/lecithinase/hemolysin